VFDKPGFSRRIPSIRFALTALDKQINPSSKSENGQES
jgi:hypothetical protein